MLATPRFRRRRSSTAAVMCSPWAGWPIMFASECTAIRHISMSIATSIPRMCAVAALPAVRPSDAKKDSPGAYTMALDEAYETAAPDQRSRNGVSHRRRIASGSAVSIFPRSLRWLKQRFPQVHLKTLPWSRLPYLPSGPKFQFAETLVTVESAGWILTRRGRKIFCRPGSPHHLRSQDRWRSMARHGETRHQRTQVKCEMLYGHVGIDEDRVRSPAQSCALYR